jgi:hypothetical protein
MNEAVRNRRYRNHPRALQVKTSKGPHPLAVRFGILLLMVLAGGICHVWVTDSIEKRERELRNRQNLFADNSREIENIKLDLESRRTSEYIFAEIEKRRLGLRPAEAGQRRIVRRRPLPRLELPEDESLPRLDEAGSGI